MGRAPCAGVVWWAEGAEEVLEQIRAQVKPTVRYEDAGALGMRVKATRRASVFDRFVKIVILNC